MAWQKAEFSGKIPVPKLSSARFPAICAGEGYRPVLVLACLWRNPS